MNRNSSSKAKMWCFVPVCWIPSRDWTIASHFDTIRQRKHQAKNLIVFQCAEFYWTSLSLFPSFSVQCVMSKIVCSFSSVFLIWLILIIHCTKVMKIKSNGSFSTLRLRCWPGMSACVYLSLVGCHSFYMLKIQVLNVCIKIISTSQNFIIHKNIHQLNTFLFGNFLLFHQIFMFFSAKKKVYYS